jgi:hypothetical protein
MKFRDRIRRIEEKLFPQIKQDGKKLIPPILVSQLIRGSGPRDEEGRRIGPPVVCDSRTAEVTVFNGGTKTFVRELDETPDAFEKRCCDSLRGAGGAIRMKGDGGEES